LLRFRNAYQDYVVCFQSDRSTAYSRRETMLVAGFDIPLWIPLAGTVSTLCYL